MTHDPRPAALTELVHRSGRLIVQHRTDRDGMVSIIATLTLPAPDQMAAERMAAAIAHELVTDRPAILATLSAAVRDRLRRLRRRAA